MLDLRRLREQPEAVARALATRGGADRLACLLEHDAERRRLIAEGERLKAERNRASDAIGQARRRGEDTATEAARVRDLGDRIRELDAAATGAEEALTAELLRLPNVPHPSVPVGATAEANVEVRRRGTPRAFGFTPKPHDELGAALGLLDTARAARLAKARFAVLWGPAARLERALAQFMLDLHTRDHGYTEVWVPHLVGADAMQGAGQLPKFEEQLFKTEEPDERRSLYLIPTAEVPLTALHAGEVLAEATLPRRYVACTPCYRREAGTYGQDTRGILRQHQFDKVELVKVTTPDRSYDELESLVADAERVLELLGLPYRVMLLASGDMGASAAKTYDLEVWLPGQDRYREISSCSNCEDFQARRLDLRFRRAAGGRPELCHTLNGSGLAVGRALIAVLENYQDADGSVRVPEALRPYMGGVERLGPGAGGAPGEATPG